MVVVPHLYMQDAPGRLAPHWATSSCRLGTFIGALIGKCWRAVCAIIATRDDTELAETFADMSSVDLSFFSNSTTVQLLKHMVSNGALQDHKVLQKRLSNILGKDMTFEEAYYKTGALLFPPLLLMPAVAGDLSSFPRLGHGLF